MLSIELHDFSSKLSLQLARIEVSRSYVFLHLHGFIRLGRFIIARVEVLHIKVGDGRVVHTFANHFVEDGQWPLPHALTKDVAHIVQPQPVVDISRVFDVLRVLKPSF